MRGRTNIVQRLGAIVNGDLISAKVSGEAISAGDFVSVEYASENVEMFTEPKTFQKVINIDNSNLYLIINQESGSNLALYLYEYKNDKFNLLNSKITSFSTFKNYCYLEDNCFLILADTSGFIFEVDVYNNTISFVENSESIINYSECFLLKKNDIKYLITGGFSTSSYKFNYYIYSVNNGVLTKINTSVKTLTLITYSFKSWSGQFAKSVNFNKVLFSFFYKSSNSSTSYEMVCLCELDDELELLLGTSKSVFSSPSSIGISVSNKIVINNEYLLLINTNNNRIELYNENLSVVSTISYLSYVSSINKIMNYWEDKCIFYYNNNFYILDFNENDLSFRISNNVEISLTGYTNATDSILLNSNGVKDEIFVFNSYGYNLVTYQDGILLNGIEELSNNVTKYNGISIGFAKTGGTEGQTIQVYVPIKEDS